jgi:dynein heavy chain
MRSLSNWIENLLLRAQQLSTWCEEPTQAPAVTIVSYLFNPQSYLTAIMQVTAQKNKLELDKLMILTDVTRKTPEQTEGRARDGAYVTGLFLEGARWNWQAGVMEESLPKEMYCELPVVNCRAILSDKMEKSGIYLCPTYYTAIRGPTYIFTANMRTKSPPAKWVLAGACLILEVD